MNKNRLGWIMEDPGKKPQEKPQKREEPKKTVEGRYYQGKYEVEILTPQSDQPWKSPHLCRAMVPFTMRHGNLEKTVAKNEEFLVAESRFLWKRKRDSK